MWDIWVGAFQSVFNLTTLLFIWGGVLLGVVLGAIPGLNSTMGTALLIPFTYAMNPANGLAYWPLSIVVAPMVGLFRPSSSMSPEHRKLLLLSSTATRWQRRDRQHRPWVMR